MCWRKEAEISFRSLESQAPCSYARATVRFRKRVIYMLLFKPNRNASIIYGVFQSDLLFIFPTKNMTSINAYLTSKVNNVFIHFEFKLSSFFFLPMMNV